MSLFPSVRKLPSSQERVIQQPLHSASREDALGLTEPSAETTVSDGIVHSPDHHESYPEKTKQKKHTQPSQLKQIEKYQTRY